ncbi:MAG TPA: hypothetical protein VER55_03255, partial [Ardenticatenaceae bacterium]|nr:hypothetical protein [Ardenticatenaceae bacterium]
GAVVELPRLLAYRRDEQRVAPLRSLPGAILHAKWRDSEWTEPAEQGLDLARAAPAGAGDCVVRLLQDDELLDQIDARPGKSDRGPS